MAIYVLIAHCHWLMLIDALILITSWRSCPSGNVPVQRWRFQGARRRPPVIVNPTLLSIQPNCQSNPIVNPTQLSIQSNCQSNPTVKPIQLSNQSNCQTNPFVNPTQLSIQPNCQFNPIVDPTQLSIQPICQSNPIVNPTQQIATQHENQWNEYKSLSRPIIPSPPPISPPPPSYLPPSPPPPSHLPPSHPSLSSPPHNPPLLTSPLLLFSPYMLLLLIYRVVLQYH